MSRCRLRRECTEQPVGNDCWQRAPVEPKTAEAGRLLRWQLFAALWAVTFPASTWSLALLFR